MEYDTSILHVWFSLSFFLRIDRDLMMSHLNLKKKKKEEQQQQICFVLLLYL